MGLDIRVKERKEIRCPDCGRVVDFRTLGCTTSAGREWYDFLGKIGYYIPFEEITEDQAKQLAAYAAEKQVYDYESVESVVAKALMHGNKVVINADW